MIINTSLDDFYKRICAGLPEGIAREIGHFNVFESEKLFNKTDGTRTMPYSRRAYYKISWLQGNSRVEYAAFLQQISFGLQKVISNSMNCRFFSLARRPFLNFQRERFRKSNTFFEKCTRE
jgi:hypothetical protein